MLVIISYDDKGGQDGCAIDRQAAAGKLSAFERVAAPRSLTHGLIAQITADITSGRLKPGARLPTEQELIAATGVSRTVVREAVAALRADGLVVTRQGVGAFVAETSAVRSASSSTRCARCAKCSR